MTTTLPIQTDLQLADGEIGSRAAAKWNACIVSRRHPFKETANEDAYGIVQVNDDTSIFAIADGCGGMRGGELASKLAIEILMNSIEAWKGQPSRMRAAILDGIEQANEEIRQLRMGAACTIAVIEYQFGQVRPYHVGDSRIIVMGGRGRVRYQSICHSPIGFAVESGMLEADEAMHHENRHLVSNVVGCENMRIEIGPTLRLGVRDTVVLATDGLFDNVQLDGIVSTMRKGKLIQSTSDLIRFASERMNGMADEPCKPDDMTMIAFRASK